MTQRRLFWEGDSTAAPPDPGDCGPYNQTHWNDQFFRSILNATGDKGVLMGWLNELEVSGSTSPLSVNTGGAVVYGMFYENDTAVSVSVPTPSSGFSRYDRIVIRRDWASQTARAARVSGVAAVSPSVPALTQTAGTVYEIPLATVLITDAGVITLTDTRDWCTFCTAWTGGLVTASNFATGAVTAAKILNRPSRYVLKDAGQIAGDSVTPPTWTAGGSYNYWSFADAATNIAWVYSDVPPSQAGANVSVYLWSVPGAAAAGNVQWDYDYSVNATGSTVSYTSGNTLVAQGGRAVNRVYRDLLIAIPAPTSGTEIILEISRDGAADSYNSTVGLLGVEFNWTADA
jgi:hypothetical protein